MSSMAAQRQRFRQRILQVSLDDLKRVGQSYLQADKASIAVITNSVMESSVQALGLDVVHL